MLSGIPLFPEQASTLAPEVDNLYFFILGVTAFFAHRWSCVLVVYLRGQVPDRRSADGRRADHRLDPARARLVDHPVPHFDGDLRVGDRRVLRPRAARPIRRSRSTPPASGGCGSSSTSTARARSTSCTCRSAAPVKVTFTSEDVLHSLFFPAFRVKADAIPGPLQLGLVHGDQGRRVPPLLRRVLRHQALRDDRQGRRHGAGAIPGVAERRRRRRLAGRARRAAVQRSRLQHLPPRATAPAAGRRWSNKFGTQEQLANGAVVTVDESYVRESILTPQAKLVAGYQPLMPTFQGLVNEESVMALIEYVKSLQARRRRGRRRPPRRRQPRQRRRTSKTMATIVAAPASRI